jgi:hypothetical protein
VQRAPPVTIEDPPTRDRRKLLTRAVAFSALFLVAYGVAFATLRPVTSAAIGPDAAAPVIEFERLVAGQRLEGPLTQTSKPLLTAVYGLLYSAGHDWRPVAWAAIAAFALCVVLGTWLAGRLAGPISAGFVAIAFLLSPVFILDVVLAYAVSWAVLAWLVAGLAASATRPRFGLATVALIVAALARPESLAVSAVACAGVLVTEILSRRGLSQAPPRAAYLVFLSFASIPILMVHDQLLVGQPLYWLVTSQINSLHARNLRTLVGMVLWMGHHVIRLWPLLPLAALGMVRLAIRRQWSTLVGIVGILGGTASLLILAGVRGVDVSLRYLGPIDLGLIFVAGLGLANLDGPAIRRILPAIVTARRGSAAITVLGGAVLGVVLAPAWPLDGAVRSEVQREIAVHADAQRALAVIRSDLLNAPSWRGLAPVRAISSHPLVVVPVSIRAQAVVDLDLPLGMVAYSYPTWLDPLLGRPAPVAYVFVDRRADKPALRYDLVEISAPTRIGPYLYVPLLIDRPEGFWVDRVEGAPAP